LQSKIANPKSKMKLPLYWIDAFTDRVFAGNPAAVVPLDSWLPEETMQRIAFENGLAETAFFVPVGPGRYQLRWFTPVVEVKLCGHATLASAWTLFHQLGLAGDRVVFDSLSGPLHVARRADGQLELDFPATPPQAEASAALRSQVAAALGVEISWLGRSPFDVFAVISSAATLATLRPDLPAIAALGGRGLIVTADGGPPGVDFVLRFFAPQAGVPEDPVTGSAHCALVPYWAGRLGRSRLVARQLSARGGELHCELAGDRVKMSGHAVLYLKGEISL
jgi:PhzF family phenazine biosynthesis protein